VDGLPAIYLNESPLTSRPTAALSKSLAEKSVALLAIILLSPVLLLIALAVKLNSPGPVFFKQDRHGWNGKVIQVWKFRSMRVHDDHEVKQASRNDSRITAVGRFIRRTSLDELPQLFNVLQGHMALVGLHGTPSNQTGHYGPGANQWLPWRDGHHRQDAEACRDRPQVHQQLVVVAGPEDPGEDAVHLVVERHLLIV
jgi:lipopolysaccharide/colanic/teichoic acid biosynthesis glycosyltransferase